MPDLPLSRALAPVLVWRASSPSTNRELAGLAADVGAWPDGAVLVTDDQTAGRGRLGREWAAPAGRMLAISVVLRPRTPYGATLAPESLGWLPLLASLAMTRAVRGLGVDAGLKWPNDVLAQGGAGRAGKLCGVLAELLPGAADAVVGAGLNLTLTEEELPVERASSLLLAGGVEPGPDAALAAYLRELFALHRDFRAAAGDAEVCGLRAAVAAACDTLGREVRVELPSGDVLRGRARDVDADGRLVVETGSGHTAVAAGDVTHLRY